MGSSTQYYDNSFGSRIARTANNITNTVQPVVQAVGTIASLGSATASIGKLGYQAIKSPFDLFEFGQRTSAFNSLKELNNLNSSFSKDPYNFSEAQFDKAQEHIANVKGFTDTYGARGNSIQGSIIPGITPPDQIRRMESNLASHSSKDAFGGNYEAARERLMDLNAKKLADDINLNNYNTEDAEALKQLGSAALDKDKDAFYYVNYLNPVSSNPRKVQQDVMKLDQETAVYNLNKDKNNPDSISKCRQSILNISKLIKESDFPQEHRLSALKLQYDYAVRSRKWKA